MNKYHISFKGGPTRFLLVFYAILTQNLKYYFYAIFCACTFCLCLCYFLHFCNMFEPSFGFSLGTVGQHFGPSIEIGQTRVMIDIKASDAHSRV